MELLPTISGRFPDRRDALVVDGEGSSWEMLAARSGELAGRISGERAIAVCARPTLDTVVAVVAGLIAGVPVVPVPPDAGPVERRHILGDSGATAVVGDDDWSDCDLPRRPVPARPGAVGRATDTTISAPADGAATALIMYTSGTTGLPKGVQIPRRAIAAGLDGLADAWGWTPDDRLAHGLPLFHVHGLILGVLGPLRLGSALTHTGRPTPERYAAAGASMYFGVPTVWHRVVADPTSARALRSARILVSGSAALPAPVFDGLAALTGQRPLERYGMTETLITLSTRHDRERIRGTVGWPIAGVATRLVDDHGRPAAHDGSTIGHLQVTGSTMFSGYLHRPDADAASATDDSWFVTGDAATIDADGVHRIAGRTSTDIIKTGGYKVGAGEVESTLLGHPGVAEVAVVGAPDDDLGERIVAYVVGDATDPDALIDHVARELSVHKRPREIRFVDRLPRNAMGKVEKQRLT